jgi:hypothetical protein
LSGKPEALDAAWLAGFFDGEGCVGIYPRGERERASGSRMRVTVTQRPRRVLDLIAAEYGGHVYERSSGVHGWTIEGPSALPFLVAVQPHLRLKGPQVEIALAFQARRKHGIPSQTPDQDTEDAVLMKELKRAS